ncbi:hypothetical protein [Mitsuaria sp. GD03876]|uniref:hypothetical protein n=1 Tax=Mitsuaria sp. GD03876 TaxID=2975399 RepID=UPI00244A79F0|nr:hypothetical protein [Mitsuaria sp. GD03876]MDH0867587.1 hypothetical protein [Mitsuaria sp. GD03876]
MLLDEGRWRHAFEPAGGVRSWLQLASRPDGWHAPAHEPRHPPPDAGDGTAAQRPSLLAGLVNELRMHLCGPGAAARSRLPGDVATLLAELERLQELPFDDARRPRMRTGRRPTPADFLPGETLSGPTRLSGEEGIDALRGRVAQSLGAALRERFGWERPATVHPGPIDRLADQLASAGDRAVATPRSWSLKVGRDRDVALVLQDGGKDTVLGTVLPAGPHLSGVAILRADPKDDLADEWARAGTLYNGEVHANGRFMLPRPMARADARRPLAGLDLEGRLMVMGHGQGNPFELALRRGGIAAPGILGVGGLHPQELARELVAHGLPRGFKGSIQLHACGSAQTLGTEATYAHQFQRSLADLGWDEVSVAGLPGRAAGLHNLTFALPAVPTDDRVVDEGSGVDPRPNRTVGLVDPIPRGRLGFVVGWRGHLGPVSKAAMPDAPASPKSGTSQSP